MEICRKFCHFSRSTATIASTAAAASTVAVAAVMEEEEEGACMVECCLLFSFIISCLVCCYCHCVVVRYKIPFANPLVNCFFPLF